MWSELHTSMKQMSTENILFIFKSSLCYSHSVEKFVHFITQSQLNKQREREVYIKSLSYNKETRDSLNDYYKDYILRFSRSKFDYLVIVETDCEWL